MTIIMIITSIPPAAKMLVVIGAVYSALQGAKKIPQLTPYLTGWIAVAVNLGLTVCGLLVAVPVDQLYTTNTLMMVVIAGMSAAGIHGTVKSLSPPTVLAVTPPSLEVKEVPATLVPDNPAAIPVEPKGKSQ